MNKVLPVVSVCIAILAFAFALVPRTAEPVPSLVAPEGGASEEEVADLRRRIDQLEDDNRALWSRVLNGAPQHLTTISSDAGADPVLARQVELLRQEIHSVMVGETLTNEAARTALKDIIRETNDERVKEQLAMAQTRQQERAEGQKVRWKEFVTTARLTSQQETQLNERLALEDQARKNLSALGRDEAREGFRALRQQQQETDRVMAQTLDESQKTQYQLLRREERGGGGGRPSGGGQRQQPSP